MPFAFPSESVFAFAGIRTLFNELELLKLAAAERRSKARLELRQHEASHQVEVVKPQVQRDA